jgi:hypothetical protein
MAFIYPPSVKENEGAVVANPVHEKSGEWSSKFIMYS